MSVLKPWRVTASKVLVEDRWIRLRADACETADGHRIAPYYVLDYPDWVQVVAISPEDQVLLIEQYRHGVGRISLELPAGGIDPGDIDPIAAARRELLEETGCRGKEAILVQNSPVNPASHTNLVHTVLIHDVGPVQAPAADPGEQIAVRWTDPAAAHAAALAGRLPGLQAASLLAAFHVLGWLRLRRP